jgi:ABC-type antimicrobial peptide transport system permease subunit
LSVTLLIGAGLLFRSFWRLQQVEPGFNVATVMTARIRLPSAAYGVRTREAFIERLLSEIRTLPGVVSAATSSAAPLTAGNTSTEVRVPGVESRDIIRRIDPGAPLYELRSMNDLRDDSLNPRRFNMYLVGVFAGTALLVAAIGLFGVMAYLVSQRTGEIGVRMALGADRSAILWLVLRRGLALSAAGAGIGIGLALGLTRLMQSLLYSVTARDPATFVAVPVLLVAVALAACYLPARRALKVDPVTALRAE